MNTPAYPSTPKTNSPQPVKIVSIDLPFSQVFLLVFRVVLSLCAISAVLGLFYAVLVSVAR